MAASAPRTYRGRGMRVLICDDEDHVRKLFRLGFEAEGAVVDEACDSDECLRLAGENCPDLVILDLFMPRRDGLATLPLLRQRCPDAPVLVVSGRAAVEILEASRARGATACFDKVGFVERIPALVERYCSAA
jgi:two-component system nitrogen regulation response regulator NtrX